ncbi:MAG: redoxin domain-containing protein [Bdellovibrionales bacterium]|nr:redoxin domain-containing protein [Bdellovibrionales bacterium]
MKFLSVLFVLVAAQLAFADAEVGKAAPDFSLSAQDGKTYKLADFKGKYLVLEWFNKDCPYVKKHYGANNMQTIQKKIVGDKEITFDNKKVSAQWLSVISSAPGKQGHLSQDDAKKEMTTSGMNSTALLLDNDGKMGKAYGAKTTPHVFIVNPNGKVVYAGAIDSDSSSDPATIAKATNYITAAFEDLKAKKNITNASTKPYGCAVKY